MKKIVFLFAFCVALSGCTMGKDYVRPDQDLPEGSNSDFSSFTSDKWWENFNDQVLNKLIEKALTYNQDLKAAMARVDQARAVAGVSDASRMPSVSATAEGGDSSSGESYSAGVGISYELDLWGKYKRLSESKRAKLLASEASKDAVIISLTADVAKTYFALRSNDAQLAVAERTLEARKKTAEIYEKRVKEGLSSNLDLQRVNAEMFSVETNVQNLRKAIGENETALSVLIGSNPREIVVNNIERGKELADITVIPDIPEGVPSDLLERRPDIMQAEEELISANAEIGAARAEYFPSISLTAGAGSASSSLMDLFTGGLWSFVGSAAQPIFEGGKIKEKEKLAKAQYQEMLAKYQKTIQAAFKETLDALNANKINRETVISVGKQKESLGKAYEIALKQKDAGLIGLLDVLDAERNLLSSELSYAQSQQNQLNAIVDVCKALGGGWQSSSVSEKQIKEDSRKREEDAKDAKVSK